MAMRLSHYAHRHFHNLFKNRKDIINNSNLMGRIHISYSSSFARALRGYLLVSAECCAEALQLLTQARETITLQAQHRLNYAAAGGICGFNDSTGRAYLEMRVLDYYDEHAQHRLNEAAMTGRLGFDSLSGRIYLEKRILDHSDKQAQQSLNSSSISGRLGFNSASGRSYLEERIRHGDHGAQQTLIYVAACGKDGIPSFFNDATGRSYLEERSRFGDKTAQEMLNRSASNTSHTSGLFRLGFDNVTGRSYLEERLRQGDRHARQMLNRAAVLRRIGFDDLGTNLSRRPHTKRR